MQKEKRISLRKILTTLVTEVRGNSVLIKAVDGRVGILDGKVGVLGIKVSSLGGAVGTLGGTVKELKDGVERNSVLLKAVHDNILKLVEGQEGLREKTDRMQNTLSAVEEKTEQIDARLLCVEIIPK